MSSTRRGAVKPSGARPPSAPKVKEDRSMIRGRTLTRGLVATLVVGFWIAAAAPGTSRIAAKTQQAPETAAPVRAVLDQYCVTCHNEKLKTAGLALDALDPANVAHDAD